MAGNCFRQLCLPQIPSAAGGGRRVPAANQMFGPRFAGAMEEHEKSTLRLANKGSLVLSGSENRHTCFWIGIARGLLRSGCAPLVAVVKTANLRYGNDGSEFRRVHGPRFRRVLGQREVRPGFVIIRQEGLHVPVQ